MMIRKERNFENFLNDKIKNLSKSSKESITYSNRIFDEFCQKQYKQTIESLIKEAKLDEEPEDVMLEVVQGWVNSVSEKFSYSALRVYLSGINRYLKYHKMKVDLTDLELPQNLQEERYAISSEEIQKILEMASFDKRGYYLALISTGARPVEILGLRKSDIELLDGKYKATIPAFLTKKKDGKNNIFFK